MNKDALDSLRYTVAKECDHMHHYRTLQLLSLLAQLRVKEAQTQYIAYRVGAPSSLFKVATAYSMWSVR